MSVCMHKSPAEHITHVEARAHKVGAATNARFQERAALKLIDAGWTAEAAFAHATHTCDQALCSGRH